VTVSNGLVLAVNEVSRGERFIPQRRKIFAFLYETCGVFNWLPDLGDSTQVKSWIWG
jgi:hypothetical protein